MPTGSTTDRLGLVVCFFLALVASACTRSNPAYCRIDADCSDPVRPHCDPLLAACVGGDADGGGSDADGADGVDGTDGADLDGDGEDGEDGGADGDEDGSVVFVAGSECQGTGSGTAQDPYCSLFDAADAAPAGGTLSLAPGEYALEQTLSISQDLRIEAPGGASLEGGTCPVLLATGGAVVVVEGVDFSAEGGEGESGGVVQASGGAALRLHRVRIQESGCLGLRCAGAECELTEAWVLGNEQGGVDLDDTRSTLVNVVIAGNGGAGSVGGLRVTAPRQGSRFGHLTVAHNQPFSGSVGGVDCAPGVAIVNSILWANGGQASSPDCVLDHVHLDPDPGFVDEDLDDYHLLGTSPCIDQGDAAQAPAIDIDGEARPAGLGVDLGADEAR